MRLTFPNNAVSRIASFHNYGGKVLTMIERKLNQNPLYMLSYDGVVIHAGKRKHIVRTFNRYARTIGTSLQQHMAAN